MKKAVAVCVTYGRPHLVRESVQCFLNQSYLNKQLIILSDQAYSEADREVQCARGTCRQAAS